MRSWTLMVRSAATPRVSNHEAVAELVRIQFFKQRHFLRTQLRDLAARFCARFARNVPPSEIQRAQGMPSARCARSLVCEKTNTRAKSPRSHRNDPAFPAQWFYGLLRALPGDQACLTPSPARLLADLTPALGRQNDTTSPYASAPFVKGAAASTASRPALVTCATPLFRDGT